MRSPDNDSRRNYPENFMRSAINAPIPDVKGAPVGTSGIKSPASPRQQGEIADRVTALGGPKLIKQ